MEDAFVFGYGSLVNRATHDYPRAAPARLAGWRRAWTHTTLREVAYLSAVPAPGAVIEGLIAAVPGPDWADLDHRERAYARHEVGAAVAHDAGAGLNVRVYAVPPDRAAAPSVRHPILLSYIDVVVQGYLREFGPEGARRFFATTDGWEAPILNDRARPAYGRHQRLSAGERGLVDAELSRRGATVIDRR